MGNKLLIYSIPNYSCYNKGLFGSKIMVISFPLSLHRYLLSTSKNRCPFLLKCSAKRGTFNFFVLLNVVSQNFQVGNEAQVTHYSKSVTFFAPSKRVGGPLGDSTHRGAAVRPVLRGSTHLISGPGHTGA